MLATQAPSAVAGTRQTREVTRARPMVAATFPDRLGHRRVQVPEGEGAKRDDPGTELHGHEGSGQRPPRAAYRAGVAGGWGGRAYPVGGCGGWAYPGVGWGAAGRAGGGSAYPGGTGSGSVGGGEPGATQGRSLIRVPVVDHVTTLTDGLRPPAGLTPRG